MPTRGDDLIDVDDPDAPDASRRPPLPPDEDEGGGVMEVIVTISVAIALALLVQQFLVKPFRIPSGSMERTLRCGDRVLVDRISYRFTDIERGDVVVFNPPAARDVEGDGWDTRQVNEEPLLPGDDGLVETQAADVNFIKRVVAMPGEEVEVIDHGAWIDGEPLDEPYLYPLSESIAALDGGIADWGPFTVPEGTYLMLGDHRNNSKDGRVFSWVPEEFVVGKAFMVYWPPSQFGGIPAEDSGDPPERVDPKCQDQVNAIPAEAGG